ncbi:MAG: formimidoylglutamate deiminase [Pseudomonadota bacterium]
MTERDPTVTWHVRQALLPDGWAENVRISVSGTKIAKIETGRPAEPGDVRIGIGLPTVGNLHSHAFQRAMAGLTEISGPDGDSFWTWRQRMYRFVDAIGPEDMEAIAAFAFMEMAEAGFGRVGEFHYLHHDIDGGSYADPAEMAGRVAAAANEAGIGLTLLPVFYAHGGFGGQPPAEGQRRFICNTDSYSRLLDGSRQAVGTLPDAIVGIAPHSLRAVTREELDELLVLAGGNPVHIHIAEQVREVEDCLSWSGARPVRWLLDHTPVDARWCLVHATHMDSGEAVDLARSGAVAGLCPITEANLGDGLFPARAFAEAGGAYGIGSDSNVRIDMTEELRLLEYGQRLAAKARNVMATGGLSTGRTLFDQCVIGGARALGVEGGIAVGASADLVVLDEARLMMSAPSGDTALDTLVFSAGQAAIGDVWIAGKRAVAGGRHENRDAIESRYRRAISRLLSS